MQVKVRALIWHGDQIIVARESRQGRPHLTLPGGRPRSHETLVGALMREVREETGLEIQVGRLLYVAECVNGFSLQELILIFTASPTSTIDPACVELVHPRDDEANVLPPVLSEIARDVTGPPAARWLGNVYRAQSITA
jgi:ADP-ribose pyrophosphatase YjhB (NUDIX family)